MHDKELELYYVTLVIKRTYPKMKEATKVANTLKNKYAKYVARSFKLQEELRISKGQITICPPYQSGKMLIKVGMTEEERLKARAKKLSVAERAMLIAELENL